MSTVAYCYTQAAYLASPVTDNLSIVVSMFQVTQAILLREGTLLGGWAATAAVMYRMTLKTIPLVAIPDRYVAASELHI